MDLLDRIHGELRERLAASRAAVEEYERLEAVLRALEHPSAAPGQGAGAWDRRRRSAPSAARDPRQRRAPRGANREAVLRVIGERPGVTVPELAAASGVANPTLYGVLRRLVERREIARRELPGGLTGYALADE